VNDIDLVKVGNNQRLEFLGDAVLEFVISKHLYHTYTKCVEGQLTLLRNALVNNEILSFVARELGLGQYIRYLSSDSLQDGSGENRGHNNMLADTFEAFIAALFLDHSLKCVEDFLGITLLPKLDNIIQDEKWRDPKSKLQYMVNRDLRKKYFVQYICISEEGPPHQKKFTVGAYVRGECIGAGKSNTKINAEQESAKDALSKYYSVRED